MAKHGVSDEHIVMRVTGCPNGRGRAMLAEVGRVGKAPGRYNLHLGGNRIGHVSHGCIKKTSPSRKSCVA